MNKQEKLPDGLKQQIVQEVLNGKYTKEEARRIYGIKSSSGILEWMRKFADIDPKSHGVNPIPKLESMKEESKETIALKIKIKELEAELKYSELKGRAYQIMVELAKEQYGLDLVKKSGAKQSNSSKKRTQK